jgi:endoglucanase
MRFPLKRFVLVAAVLTAAACSGDMATGPVSTSSTADSRRKPKDTTTTTPPADTTTATPPADTSTSTPVPTSGNPIAGATFWIDPYSNAKKTADSWRLTRPADALQMDKIATHSQAQWFGSWSGDIYTAVDKAVTAVTNAGALPVFVTYSIPRLDCGSGGLTPDGYRTWITAFANGLRGRKAVVVLEPDALPAMGCLTATEQQTRLDLLKFAVQQLKAQGGIVYLDAGHPGWQTASLMASRLTSAGIAAADGFSLNVSNFIFTADNITYGTSISSLVSGKHFIIDTSRNGLGPTADYQWCNPSGRALGTAATTNTGNALVDALLWIKRPGESDGTCNGGPTGGSWWADYALGLAQRSTI